MILNVIEMRKNGWAARREELKMKTKAEIKKDVVKEEQKRVREANRPMPNRGRNNNSQYQQNRRGNNNHSNNNQGNPGNQGRQGVMGAVVNNSSFIGGGGRNINNFNNQRQGNMGQGNRQNQRQGPAPGRPGSLGGGRPPSMMGRQQGGNMRPPSFNRAGSGQNMMNNRGGMRPGGNNFNNRGSSGRPSAPPSMNRNMNNNINMNNKPRNVAPPPQKKPGISMDKLERVLGNTFTEYYQMKSIDDVLNCLRDTCGQYGNAGEVKHKFIEIGLNRCIDGKDIDRKCVPECFNGLVAKRYINDINFSKAFKEVVGEFWGDIKIDCPMADTNLVNLVVELIYHNGLKLDKCADCFAGLMKPEQDKLVTRVKETLKKRDKRGADIVNGSA